MAHPNEELIRQAMAATCQVNLAPPVAQFADDIVLHYPGHSPLAGDYRGQKKVVEWMRRSRELAEGQRRVSVSTVFADDERGVVLYFVAIPRGGRIVYDPTIAVVRIKDGKIAEVWVAPADLYASDELWSRGRKAG
jgi:uncharacterized protein